MKYLSILLLAVLCIFTSCSKSSNDIGAKTDNPTGHAASSGKQFELLSAGHTGVTFNNEIKEDLAVNYMTFDGIYTGAGVGTADLNNDGLTDLYFAGNLTGDEIYLNKGNMQFENITEKSGIRHDDSYSTGVSFADVNNDGYMDIYVCKFLFNDEKKLRNKLYINNGDATFTEKAAAYGIDDPGFSIQATFFDYDRDGDLDLYIANQPPNGIELRRALKGKKDFKYTDKLYRNNGDNTFSDVTQAAGITNYSFSLSCVVSDLNKDGWSDLYVACDYEEPDMLYLNNGDGTFKNASYSLLRHMSNFGMGTDIADINNDAWPDIYTADMVAADNKRLKTNMSGMNPKKFWSLANNGYHFQYMFNALQLNNGNGTFSEIAQLSGISNTDWSWSVLFFDMDNNGFQDLHVTNGLIRDMRNNDFIIKRKQIISEKKAAGVTEFNPLELLELAPTEKISNLTYRNNGDLTFSNIGDDWGLGQKAISQGACYADLDNDGDLDLVINNNNEPAFIYKNLSADNKQNNFLRFQFKGVAQNPEAIGTYVEIEYDGQRQIRELTPVRGYMSSNERVLHFGVGSQKKIDKVTVNWPDNRQTVLTDVATNQMLVLNQDDATGQRSLPVVNAYFQESTGTSGVRFKHQENEFDDYAREILLPHKMSTQGPCLATADVNGDGRKDFFVGGAAGQSGKVFIQQADGQFADSGNGIFNNHKKSEDTGALFFDADGDGDQDLYVVSGGNEFNAGAAEYQDRLYLNNGKGQFTAGQLPQMRTSGGKVAAGDLDKDGDLDLFVGGRQVPGKYGNHAESYLLQNDGGKFKDVTKDLAPALQSPGMVTDAFWNDYDNDGDQDLIVAGEWMALTCYHNEKGSLAPTSENGLDHSEGWWNDLTPADVDNDGDMDFIAGNLGLNIKYKASVDEPFTLYAKDFDGNGTHDVYLGYYDSDGVCYPVRGRECSSQQMPFIKKEFKNYELFANASLDDVLGKRKQGAAYHEAKMFENVYVENLGDGQFKIHPLPTEAQFSPIFGTVVYDWNKDGHLDLVTAGNYYNREVETTRSDAGIGRLMLGDGKGGFTPVHPSKAGLKLVGDVRDIQLVEGQNPYLVIANNNNFIQVYQWAGKEVM